jgi:hypothetical protein
MIFRQDGSGKTGPARLAQRDLFSLSTLSPSPWRKKPTSPPHIEISQGTALISPMRIAKSPYAHIRSTPQSVCVSCMHKARRARNGYLEAISIPKIMSLEPTRSPTQRAPQFSCEGRERSTKRQRQKDRFWEEGELMGVAMGVAMRE